MTKEYFEVGSENLNGCCSFILVDGHLTAWGHWGSCSATCEGTRTRTRVCHPPEHGGAPCGGSTVETSGCGASHCPGMVLIVCLFFQCVDAAFRFLFIRINIYMYTSKPGVVEPKLFNLTRVIKIATRLLCNYFKECIQRYLDTLYIFAV